MLDNAQSGINSVLTKNDFSLNTTTPSRGFTSLLVLASPRIRSGARATNRTGAARIAPPGTETSGWAARRGPLGAVVGPDPTGRRVTQVGHEPGEILRAELPHRIDRLRQGLERRVAHDRRLAASRSAASWSPRQSRESGMVPQTAAGTTQTQSQINSRENNEALAPSSPLFTPETSPDLAAVVAAWPTLPGAIRAGILAMVRASTPDEGGGR
jgi:hypothetical protein